MKQRAMKQVRRESKRDRRRATLSVVTNDFEAPVAKKPTRAPIVPRNPNQAQYLNDLKTRFVTIGAGPAGAGKSWVAATHAADLLLDKKIERIVVTRPVLQADEDLGFLPGDIHEKFAPYFRPISEILKERLGPSFFEYCLRPGIEKIVIAPFAYLRGMTFKDSFVLLDEAQNTTASQMKLLLTRIGENTTLCINGDVHQCDLPSHVSSGLGDLLSRLVDDPIIGVTEFTKEDSVRGPVCDYALKIYE